MSIAQIEAELGRLSADELRRLAMSSWAAFIEKEGSTPGANECDEVDVDLLAGLDDAIRRANTSGAGRVVGGNEVRPKIREWTTK